MDNIIMDKLFTRGEAAGPFGGPPALVVYVCWNCEHMLAETGKNKSRGPHCVECGERTEAYNLISTT